MTLACRNWPSPSFLKPPHICIYINFASTVLSAQLVLLSFQTLPHVRIHVILASRVPLTPAGRTGTSPSFMALPRVHVHVIFASRVLLPPATGTSPSFVTLPRVRIHVIFASRVLMTPAGHTIGPPSFQTLPRVRIHVILASRVLLTLACRNWPSPSLLTPPHVRIHINFESRVLSAQLALLSFQTLPHVPIQVILASRVLSTPAGHTGTSPSFMTFPHAHIHNFFWRAWLCWPTRVVPGLLHPLIRSPEYVST